MEVSLDRQGPRHDNRGLELWVEDRERQDSDAIHPNARVLDRKP